MLCEVSDQSCAGAVLSLVALYQDPSELATHLQTALQSRSVIDQAKGMVMAAEHCSADEAFEKLVRLSQHQNVKLRTIASTIVDRTARS